LEDGKGVVVGRGAAEIVTQSHGLVTTRIATSPSGIDGGAVFVGEGP